MSARVRCGIGALAAGRFNVLRSGVRWLCEDGHVCRAGEVVAYCNIGSNRRRRGRRAGGRSSTKSAISRSRSRRASAARSVAPPTARSAASSTSSSTTSDGRPEFVIGHVECERGFDADGETTRSPMLGRTARRGNRRRDRSGLLSGWHDRSRAWWGDGDAPFGDAGLPRALRPDRRHPRRARRRSWKCSQRCRGPAHVAYFPDDALVPCAAVAAGQLERTPEAGARDCRRLRALVRRGHGRADAGRLDFRERAAVGAAALAARRAPRRADARPACAASRRRTPCCCRSTPEAPFVLRHKRLGYTLLCHGYRIVEAGPGRACVAARATSSRCGARRTTSGATTAR